MSILMAAIAARSRKNHSPVTYTTLNPSDRSSGVALSGGNLIATGGGSNSGFARSVKVLSGKRYFEAVFTTIPTPGTYVIGSGVARNTADKTGALGYSDNYAWAMAAEGLGAIYNSGTVKLAAYPVEGDVIGHAIDTSAGKLWLRLNGTWIQGNPVTGTSALFTSVTGTLYAAACPWDSGTVVTMRFDPASFRDAAPTGFSPVTA